MPIRIYALAKELKFDSKELVDICVKAGLPGKGSALASLDDDEVAKLKAYLAGKSKPRRPEAAEQHGHPPVLPTPTRPAPAPVAPAVSEPAPPPAAPAPMAPVAAVPAAAPPAAPEPKAPAAPVGPLASHVSPAPPAAPEPAAPPAPVAPVAAAPAPPARPEPPATPAANAPMRREDSRPLGAMMNRSIKVIGANRKRDDDGTRKKPDGDSPRPSRKDKETVIKLAAIPQAKQPAPAARAEEPPAQKPIMTLPPEAIRSAKTGSKAPLQDIANRLAKTQAKKPRGPEPPKSPAAQTTAPDPAGKGRAKKGKGGEGGEEESGKAAGSMGNTREERQQKRKRVIGAGALSGEEERQGRARRPKKLTRTKSGDTAAPRKTNVSLEVPCSVRAFSEASGVGVTKVLKLLFTLVGPQVTINHMVDRELAEYLAAEFEAEVQFKEKSSLEDAITGLDQEQDSPEAMVTRPPVVTFLGHVDHGKTSLLDAVIGTKLVSGEAGGITQHIRAYQVEKDGKRISFVDTPGHEAFTEMRARGANVTDIAVLVVAADDGVMPQTEEAISHARAAKVPIVVAMNKIDLPSADEQKVFRGLAEHNLLPTEWGGDVEVVRTSATTGRGLDTLLETLLLTAELHEYKANPNRKAMGTCLEAEQQGKRGVMAKLIVQNGTLHVGDIIVCGAAHGRVKAIYDTLDSTKRLEEAGPSLPVSITGLDIAPQAGDRFHVLDDISQARNLAEQRSDVSRVKSLTGYKAHVSFTDFTRLREAGQLGEKAELVDLRIILRADTRGSIEAILKELSKIDHPEVRVTTLQASVGGITVGDVTLADASDAVVVGFNVIPDEAARALAEARGVEIRRYDIIYKLTDDIKAVLEGRLKPEERVKEMGRALVQKVFNITRVGAVAGCRVLSGTIERSCRVRVNRESRTIGDYTLDSLKREKDDAREVREGLECGIKLSGFNDLKEGDILEAYKIEEVARTL